MAKPKKSKGKAKEEIPLSNKGSLDYQGFLLPTDYKMRTQWEVNPLFRSTLLLLILTIIWGATLVPRWFLISERAKAVNDQSQTSLQESQWLEASLTKIRPIRTKYQEIEEMLQFRRIPITPLLSSIQRHIPNHISLIGISWETTLDKTTENINITGRKTSQPEPLRITRRRADLQLDIYASPNWNPEKSPAGWLSEVERDMERIGLLISQRVIGRPEPFEGTPEIMAQLGDKKGNVLTVSLSFQLAGPQEKDPPAPKTLLQPNIANP